MATTIYGPQFWTDGDFSFPSADYRSTESGGGDAPISGYNEVWEAADVETQGSGGPSGEKILAIVPDDSFLSAAGIALTPGRVSPHAVGTFEIDVRGDGEGIVIEWWQYFRNNPSEVNFPILLALSNGGNGGTGVGLLGSSTWLEFVADLTTGSGIEYFLEYQQVNGGGTAAISHSVTGPTDTLDDAWHRMQVVIKPSTVSGDFTGGGNLTGSTVAADGSIHVYKDATPGVPHTGTPLFAVENEQFTVNEFTVNNPELYWMKGLWHGHDSMIGPVTGTWIYTLDAEDPGSPSSEEGSLRNLITGQGNTAEATQDSVIAGVLGTLVNSRRVVLLSLDGLPHEVTDEGKLIIYGDVVIHGTLTEIP